MLKIQNICAIVVLLVIAASCNKETLPDDPTLPNGATPFSTEQKQFVPYTNGSGVYTFKKAPSFTEEIVLMFKERTTPKQVYAYDHTILNFEEDSDLEIDLKLRYLQTEETSRKTLAIYMPYRDVTSAIRETVFETPISPTELDEGYFENLVYFHDTLTIEGNDWYNVFEINPLVETSSSIDDDTNYEKIFYSKDFGIIEMDQKNGSRWVLHP